MRVKYKIYCWGFICDERDRNNSQLFPSPIDCPDFNTEEEAKDWLIKLDQPQFKKVKKYFVISPTFIVDEKLKE